MTGFDVHTSTRGLSKNFYFVLLKDSADYPRTVKRMRILENLLRDRGFKVEVIELKGDNRLLKIMSTINLAHWTAYHTAQLYKVEPEQVPMVEEFKRLIK